MLWKKVCSLRLTQPNAAYCVASRRVCFQSPARSHKRTRPRCPSTHPLLASTLPPRPRALVGRSARKPLGSHKDYAIVLFDGVCNLCNRSVRTVIANDPSDRFRFAALGSAAAHAALAAFGREEGSFESIVLVDGARLFERSDAALRIALAMRWPWPLLGALLAIPRDLRDRAYMFVATHRYRYFGTSATCPVPSPAIRGRFL